jgi:SAM-dependent methyltransferase
VSSQTPSVRDLYDDSASKWVRTEPSSLSDFTARIPMLELCQPVAGLRLLDLGCGEGYCARALRRRGAADVAGIDVSGGMIAEAAAQEARSPLGIRYAEGCATDLSRFPDGGKDLVVAVFLFNYLTVAEMHRTMGEVARVLAPGGRFVFTVPHPSFPYMRKAGPPFYFDIGGAGYFSARDDSFSGRIWKRDGSWLDVRLVHKTLEDYFDALAGAGFASMPKVRELRVTAEMIAKDPAFFGPLADMPLHLAVEVAR